MIRRSILPEGLPDARAFTLEDGGEGQEVQEVTFKPGWSLAPPGHPAPSKTFQQSGGPRARFFIQAGYDPPSSGLTGDPVFQCANALPGKSETSRTAYRILFPTW